jgi:hypothetical protein
LKTSGDILAKKAQLLADGYSESEVRAWSELTSRGYEVELRPPTGTRNALSGTTSDLVDLVTGSNIVVPE